MGAICRRAPLTFAALMELALYHPVGGYYTAHVELGPGGDFVTSPEEHPAFGALLARQAAQCWQVMECPPAFQVVEMGGGRGKLAESFLAYAQTYLPEFAAALQYVLIDRSPRLLALQHERLTRFANVQWQAELPTNITGLILSNELIDAFPVHRVVMREGELQEIYVAQNEAPPSTAPFPLGGKGRGIGGFHYQEGPLSTPALADYFTALGITLADGQQAEVNLGAIEWMRAVARSLARGFVITIDFGHIARELYAPARKAGTLLAYRQGQVSDDLLANPGYQDLIAHVDFSTLARVGTAEGLAAGGLVTQHHFLRNLGLEGWLAQLDTLRLEPAQRAANLHALRALLDPTPGGLGDAKVLVQARGVSAPLDGLFTACRVPNAQLLCQMPMPLLEEGC